jgi:alkane 1-monooxygenase
MIAPIQWRFAWLYALCNGPILFWPFTLNGSNAALLMLTAWAPALGIHLIVPVLDWFYPTDDSPAISGKTHVINRLMPMLCLPLWITALVMAFMQLSGQIFPGLDSQVSYSFKICALSGMTVSLGAIGGTLAINPAHELIHRASKIERQVGGLLLAAVCYGAFKIEHVRGHHLNVATDRDTASATYGQNLFSFFVQSVVGTFVHANHCESKRLEQAGIKKYSMSWLVKNEVLRLNTISAMVFGCIASTVGWAAALMFLGVSLVAILELEIINYIEHYGLRRKIDQATGRPEPVTPLHSWNTSTPVSNAFLFNLQRHSDHHAHAGKDYLHLENVKSAPQLPFGYGIMLVIALVPPLWRKVMHPRIAQLRN